MCIFIDGIGNKKKQEENPFNGIKDKKIAEDKPPLHFF
jgi:hypothetical protein